jgi:TonB family protein
VKRAAIFRLAAVAASGAIVAAPAAAEGPPVPKDPASAPATSDASRPTPIAGTCTRPEYPFASIRLQEKGTSFIGLTVDATGRVTGSSVLKSSGSTRLDRAAADALSACRFKPARDPAGTAVASTYPMRFDWRLEDAPADPWVALRALNGAGFAPTTDFAAVPFTGDSAATPEQRAKMLQAASGEALEKAQCPSIEQASARIAQGDRKADRRSLELWTVKQCGQVMRYAVAIVFPEARRPSYRMMPLAPSQADPYASR